MDPATLAILAKLGTTFLTQLLDAGWEPSEDDLKAVTDRRKKAVADWDAAGPQGEPE